MVFCGFWFFGKKYAWDVRRRCRRRRAPHPGRLGIRGRRNYRGAIAVSILLLYLIFLELACIPHLSRQERAPDRIDR